MPVEIVILFLAALLLLVHVFSAGDARTKQYGIEWNMGARDEAMPPLNPYAGRLARAQTNFQETLPIAIMALLGAVAAGRTSEWTAIGGWIWLGARVVYLPVYGKGIPKIRTFIFLASLVGLAIVIGAVVFH
ncbi:MAPEG family protein [Sphingomonas sp. BIUV-7]|uniref:MAPEG family protein n=1 Tax=Sphingomonas natans TaxID=3063330 RepID=A0ABT8Y854_9SPHN|nr:MAPEG family protein [Sphingomonas sp. BIUV-7]MDO6414506.1 MAPEG family protein [Sphingomonas sp. BIUV-7]